MWMIYNVILYIISQVLPLNLYNFPVYYLVWQLPKIDQVLNSLIISEVVHEQSLSPQILVQIELLKLLVLNDEKVKNVLLPVVEYGLSLGSVRVV